MERDGHIRILPLHVANKIAAGEVVERPASALKELVENAIDAGADRIDISVTAGGRKLVAVRDNGCGMNRDDALLSLERQATSKIRDVDDIERIDTLGFRGEAIPSIAAVSRFTLVTRRKEDEAGTRLVVNAGTVAEVAACGAPPGTCVEVRDLFCNVPARRKFLRSYATEEGHIKSVFTISALAHPELGFSLTIDGRELHRFAPGATLEERIADLFGRDFSDELIAIRDVPGERGTGNGERGMGNGERGTGNGERGMGNGERGTGGAARHISVHGYISRPTQQTLRREQFIFVNGRPASAPIIAYAIKEAYPAGRTESRPSLFLFIEVPPQEVDVNVHPAKREVRFRHPADIKAAIVTALSSALNPQPASAKGSGAASPHSETLNSNLETLNSNQETPNSKLETLNSKLSSRLWTTFKVLACTESGYLLLETDSGLVTLNPQAAQERIAYERLMTAFDPAHGKNAAVISQPLLLPETVHFSPLESARLKSFCAVLQRQGFEIEEFGTDTWKIDAVPALLAGQNATAVIASVVYDIAEAGAKRGDRWREELIAKSVARSYAGIARKFTVESATKLVEDLCRTTMPYVCPRGKPVMIFTSNRELSRKFGA